MGLKQEFAVCNIGNGSSQPPALLNCKMKPIPNGSFDNSAGILILSTPLTLPKSLWNVMFGFTPSHSRHDSYSLGAAQWVSRVVDFWLMHSWEG